MSAVQDLIYEAIRDAASLPEEAVIDTVRTLHEQCEICGDHPIVEIGYHYPTANPKRRPSHHEIRLEQSLEALLGIDHRR